MMLRLRLFFFLLQCWIFLGSADYARNVEEYNVCVKSCMSDYNQKSATESKPNSTTTEPNKKESEPEKKEEKKDSYDINYPPNYEPAFPYEKLHISDLIYPLNQPVPQYGKRYQISHGSTDEETQENGYEPKSDESEKSEVEGSGVKNYGNEPHRSSDEGQAEEKGNYGGNGEKNVNDEDGDRSEEEQSDEEERVEQSKEERKYERSYESDERQGEKQKYDGNRSEKNGKYAGKEQGSSEEGEEQKRTAYLQRNNPYREGTPKQYESKENSEEAQGEEYGENSARNYYTGNEDNFRSPRYRDQEPNQAGKTYNGPKPLKEAYRAPYRHSEPTTKQRYEPQYKRPQGFWPSQSQYVPPPPPAFPWQQTQFVRPQQTFQYPPFLPPPYPQQPNPQPQPFASPATSMQLQPPPQPPSSLASNAAATSVQQQQSLPQPAPQQSAAAATSVQQQRPPQQQPPAAPVQLPQQPSQQQAPAFTADGASSTMCDRKSLEKCSAFARCDSDQTVTRCWEQGNDMVFDETTKKCLSFENIPECSKEFHCAGKFGWSMLGGACSKISFNCGDRSNAGKLIAPDNAVVNPSDQKTLVGRSEVLACSRLP